MARRRRTGYAADMNTPIVAQKSPYPVSVEAGKTYAWCTCGGSKSQPLCDGSHKGFGFTPMIFKATKTETIYFCGCKHTKTPPLCDGTHKAL